MRKFLFNVLIFSLPLLLLLGTYEYMFFKMGETYSIKSIFIAQEQNNGSLFIRKYLSQDFRNYKAFGVNYMRPEILLIGSSRVMQIKGNYFNGKFYNAGGLIQNHKDLDDFLSGNISAKMLFIGLDTWWYKEDHVKFANSLGEYPSEFSTLIKSRYSALNKIHKILEDYFSNRTTKHIGVAAQTDNGGFRLDGSLKVSDDRVNMILKEPTFIDTEDPPVNQRIKQGTPYKFSFSKIDTTAFLSTVEKIKKLIENGVSIIVYLPPFTNESYDLFKSVKEQKAFYEFTQGYVPKTLAKNNIPHISTETPRTYLLDDTYFMDGFHPSEVFVAMQLKKHHKLFNGTIDTLEINHDVKNRYCNLFLSAHEMKEVIDTNNSHYKK